MCVCVCVFVCVYVLYVQYIHISIEFTHNSIQYIYLLGQQ